MIFRSIRSRLSLSFAVIALAAAIVLGVVLLAILQRYYLNQEIEYLRGNAKYISSLVSTMLSGNTAQDQIQPQIEGLAFLSQTRVQVYDTHGQLLYDSGSPQNIDVNIGTVKDMLSAQANEDLPKDLIQITPKDNPGATPSSSTTDRKILIYSTIRVDGSPFGFDLSSDTATSNVRSKLTIAELIHDPKTGNELGSVRLSEGPNSGSTILRSVAQGWALASAGGNDHHHAPPVRRGRGP